HMIWKRVLCKNKTKKHTHTCMVLQEALLCAQSEDRLTVGVYESAKIMTDDLDSVSFCVLAMDGEFQCDIALQIHFTLIQSFCFDNDISIVRVSDMQRLAEIVGDKVEPLEDAHCVLITVCRAQTEGATHRPSFFVRMRFGEGGDASSASCGPTERTSHVEARAAGEEAVLRRRRCSKKDFLNDVLFAEQHDNSCNQRKCFPLSRIVLIL
uniref:Growth arrest and DNA damage inducible gamma n=1 Tax=Cyclopterus lumpus TaxID=8103 RepID=A0A8C2WVX8_CYCLU